MCMKNCAQVKYDEVYEECVIVRERYYMASEHKAVCMR